MCIRDRQSTGDFLISAERGPSVGKVSWPPSGFRISRIKMAGFGTTLRIPLIYQTIVDFSALVDKQGWMKGDDRRSLRPTDIIFLHDGSMLIADDEQGAIYRAVSYTHLTLPTIYSV
eukprot:TRINITY_DN15501_c0_g1_i1.p1 TRINITY_DN15501_c0_g1~~TRINITY_DN15501_c0_g1_i1.p1  ORF type:complete len:117 (-),score=17.03 TRINITY_DN15501_c0_g1_i1:5-355(-)